MLAPHADPPLESQTQTHVAGLWRVALSGAACAPEHEAKHRRRMVLMSLLLHVPSGASFSTLPDGAHVAFAPRAEWSVILHPPHWLATHMSPAGHLGDTNFRHGPSCSAEAGKLTGNGSGQTGESLGEGRHAGIGTQIFLAREARKGLGEAALFASGSAGFRWGRGARSSPTGATHTSAAAALQPLSPWPGLSGPSTEDFT